MATLKIKGKGKSVKAVGKYLTQKAIKEIKEGKGIRCRTFEDYLKEMEK